MRAWLAALIIAAGFVVGSAPAVAEAKDATFVGHVEGSEAYIAVSKDGKKIGGYLCDDGTISRWIAYRWLEKGSAPLVAGTTGEVLGSVRIKGNAAIGTVFVGGQSLPFRAKKVRGREAGLFFAVAKQADRLLVGGWIVDADGTQRGAVSRLNMRTLTPLPVSAAPRIDPKAPSADIGEDTGVPPVPTEPQQLVVINIIAILIALLVPAVQ